MSSAVEPSADSAPAAPSERAASLWREIATVTLFELKALFLSIRSILLVTIYGTVAGAVGAFYLWAAGQIEEKIISANPILGSLDRKAMFSEMAKNEEFRQQVEPLKRLVGQRLFDAVMSGELPLVVPVVLLLSTFVLPGLVLLIGHDRISDDLTSKYCRFILQRVHRGTYLLGKILGSFTVVFGGLLVTHLILFALAAAFSAKLDVEQVLAAMPAVWLGMALFVLAYTTFTTLISSLFTPPFLALALGGIILVVLWLLSVVTPFHDVWMGTWDMQLWVLDPLAIGVYAGYALLFGAASYFVLRTRDV